MTLSTSSLSGRRIIDVHMHPEKATMAHKTPAEMAAWLISIMDRFGVEKAGLLGTVHPGQGADEVRYGNEYTRGMVESAPERFFGFCFVNPALPKAEVEAELEHCLSNPAFRGIKLEIDVRADQPRVWPVMEAAARYNVPVLHHAWTLNLWNASPAARAIQEHASGPAEIAVLARRFPEVRIIMAHLEGCGLAGLREVEELGNVWVDTSGSQAFTGTLEEAVARIGAERVLFGADLCGRGYGSQLGRIAGARLNSDQLDAILWKNTAGLFRLT